jgi:uncharacterized protein YyaL (SSP411 family)
MAHESFEDEATAAAVNADFVAVKVDREERPDVDAVYTEATQALTGQGGWPMTVFTTPDGHPFFCGTYFPPTPRHGMPSFPQLLGSVAQAWRERREEVVEAGQRIVGGLAERAGLPAGDGPPTPEHLAAAVRNLASTYDAERGGFGGAPKFPPSMVLELLLRHHARTGDPDALRMAEGTCEAMARGGIYDQLAGGFARYSVDAGWVVPHFEKMLYDNALLLRVYTHLWRATGGSLASRVALETADWMLRELRTPEGGLASALDADTDGVEGATYVWTPSELTEVLGAEVGTWAADLLSVTPGGTFEHGTSTLQLRHAPDDPERWASVRQRLFDARAPRVRPARDDKVVAAWNGLAISGLVAAWQRLGEAADLDAAVAAGRLLVDVHLVDGRLRRVSRAGVVGAPAGVLEDLGCVATAFVDLAAATLDTTWLDHARLLLDDALARFRADDGGFFDTAADAEALVARPRDPSDNASPSGLSATVHALVAFSALTGEPAYRTAAEEALATAGVLAQKAPRFAGWSLAAAEAMLDGPREVAVVGPAGPARDALAEAAYALPGAVVVVADGPRDDLALLAGRDAVDGRPAAYVCRHHVCAAPVTDAAGLRTT